MTTLHRRSLAVAGTLLVGLGGTGRAADHDGELIRLAGEFVARIGAHRAMLEPMTEEQRRAYHEGYPISPWHAHVAQTEALAGVIARIPARTPEGIQAKARALLWHQDGSDAGPLLVIGDGLLESLLADLTGTPCRFPAASRPSTPGGVA